MLVYLCVYLFRSVYVIKDIHAFISVSTCVSICVPTYGHIYVSINKSLTLMLSVNQAIFLSTPTSLSDLSMKSKFIYQQPANQPINGTHYSATQPVNQTANQTSNQSVNQSVNQPINQPINPSSCLFTHPCIGLSVHLSIHPSVYLPTYLPVFLSTSAC